MWIRRILFMLLTIGLVLGPAAIAREKRPSRGVPAEIAELRRELAELRAEIARLESQLEFQMRQNVSDGPSFALCSDPCAVDSDGDGAGDCEDACPCDPANTDGDGDGALDCFDPCPTDPADACIDPCQADSDGDGIDDCGDPCPFDPAPPVDADQDGVPDCSDPCLGEPTNACSGPCPDLDQDGDGILDCRDPCPYGEDPATGCVSPTPGTPTSP
jgi:hypothetical protein